MTDTPPLKLCISCRWIAKSPSGEVDKHHCRAEGNIYGINLVDGSKIWRADTCLVQRNAESGSGLCQAAGNWFEPKPFPPEPPKPPSLASSLLDQLK